MSAGEATSHQQKSAALGDNDSKKFKCRECSTHILDSTDIISKQFTGQLGKAYLVAKVENTVKDWESSEDRELMTGLHTVEDVSCAKCNTTLGWFYVRAEEEAQKYKEGRYLIEKELLSEA